MRETIGNTWIYQLVILFVLIFVAFLILSLTFSKNYKTKNEIINIIEKYDGVNTKSLQIINNYLSRGNRVKGNCPTSGGWIGVKDLNSTNINIEPVQNGTKYYYCINKKWTKSTYKIEGESKPKVVKSKMYYQIKIFFRFNLPVVGNIHTFAVDGTTNDIFVNTDIFDLKNVY